MTNKKIKLLTDIKTSYGTNLKKGEIHDVVRFEYETTAVIHIQGTKEVHVFAGFDDVPEYEIVEPAPEIMTVSQAAQFLNMSNDTVIRLCHKGKLIYDVINNQYAISKKSVGTYKLKKAFGGKGNE